MALKPCKECGASVSTQAFTCPQCGCPLKDRPGAMDIPLGRRLWKMFLIAFWIVAVLTALALWLSGGHLSN
jgi:hypothetical protein